MILTDEQLRQFDEDGYIVLDKILTDEQVEKARAALERIFRGEYTCDRRPPEYRTPLRVYPEQSPVAKHMVNGRLLDDDLWQISVDSRIGEIAAKLLRTRSVSLMEDQMIVKSPGGKPIAFHQDAPYLTFLRSWDVINCWIALVDVTIDMSPLLYIKGSHRWPVSAKPTHFSDGGEDDMMEVVEAARPPDAALEIVPVTVRAGGGAFYGALMMHGSKPNYSNRTRYAYTLHFAAEEARANTAHWPANYYPFVTEGVEDGGRIVSKFMPVVYSVE